MWTAERIERLLAAVEVIAAAEEDRTAMLRASIKEKKHLPEGLVAARSNPDHGAVIADQKQALEAHLALLGAPATNAVLAGATGIPASTVSQRMHALEKAGRVKRVAGVRTEIWYPA